MQTRQTDKESPKFVPPEKGNFYAPPSRNSKLQAFTLNIFVDKPFCPLLRVLEKILQVRLTYNSATAYRSWENQDLTTRRPPNLARSPFWALAARFRNRK